jgi:hypothetical protein
MGSPSREKSRRLSFFIAIMAVIGLEFDVLCNPFAPTMILHWLASVHVDPKESALADTYENELIDSIETGNASEESSPDGEESGSTESLARFCLTPEIAEAIGVRPPARRLFIGLAHLFFVIVPSGLDAVDYGREFHCLINGQLSIQAMLCRFRC